MAFAYCRKDGKATLKTEVPDTITSWVISAFAMDGETGLGLVDNTKKVSRYVCFHEAGFIFCI